MNDMNRLMEVLPEFESMDINALKRPELGVFSFEEVFPRLQSTYSLLQNFVSQQEILKDDSLVPPGLIDTLSDRISTFAKLGKQIREFDVKAGDPTPRRQSLINEVNNFHVNVINHLHPLIPLVQLRQLDPTKYAAGLQAMQAEVQTLLKSLREKDEEAEETLKSIKDVSASSGAEAYAKVFEDQAGIHRWNATKWLFASVAVFGGIILFLFYLLSNGVPEDESLPHVVREVSLRALFLLALYFGLSYSVKNYTTNKHLQVANEHRQNSLKTFEVFLKAATEPDVRSAVLLQATKSIFDPGKTGYLQKEGQVSYSLSIADIFKKQ